MNETFSTSCLSDRDRVDILLEEYRVLYSLLEFRLNTIEQRIPLLGGMLATLFGGIAILPAEVRVPALLVIPVALLWLFNTTLNHGRSKEDLLRRIDEIERTLNQLAAEDVCVFQSQHPGRRGTVGGRTGMGANLVMLMLSILMLFGCDYLFREQPVADVRAPAWYSCYVGLVGLLLVADVWRLSRYAYKRSPPLRGLLFRVIRRS